MSATLSLEEPIAMDRIHPPPTDLDLVAPGDEFVWDFTPSDIDISDLECHPLLAADLPLNSELQSTPAMSPL